MAYIVKGIYQDGQEAVLPCYLVGLPDDWTKESKEARQFATKEEAQNAVASLESNPDTGDGEGPLEVIEVNSATEGR